LLTKNVKIKIYRTIILPFVLYGCETWSFTLREEHRLRVFVNTVLRRIFGSKRDKATREWRKLYNVELNDLYCSPNIIKSRRMRWVRHVAHTGERRGIHRVLVGNPEERDHLGDPGINGRIIFRWIFRKRYIGLWTGSIWLRMGTGGGHL